jgi:hypothetical protein
VSFWGGGAAIAATALLIGFAFTQINYVVLGWPIGFVFPTAELVLVTVGFALGATIWLVGVWRSARRQRAEKKGAASVLAQVAVVLLALSFARSYVRDIGPLFVDVFSDLLEDPQWGSRTVEIGTSGRMLVIKGYITRSVVSDLKKNLEENSHVSVVMLDSGGGRQRAAIDAMRLVRSRHLDTFVSGECVSACTITFLGGRRRMIAREARLGFHAARAGSDVVETVDNDLMNELVSGGVSRDFLSKAFSTPEVWFPTETELREAGVITTTMN